MLPMLAPHVGGSLSNSTLIATSTSKLLQFLLRPKLKLLPSRIWGESLRNYTSSNDNSPQLHITVEPQGGPLEGISVLSLNRPDSKNAIGRQMLNELAEAVSLLGRERTTRCIVLRSVVPGEDHA